MTRASCSTTCSTRPTRGRYKVYLIDEVHMLSTHSFNALLKTLEEPPPHVKFLLATTDPQKLPVTVLSRCLQFNLKRLPVPTDRRAPAAHPGAGGHAVRAGGTAAAGAGGRRQHARRAVAARPAARLRRRQGERGRGARHARHHRARSRGAHRASCWPRPTAPQLLRCAQSLEEFAPDYAQVLDELAALLVRVALQAGAAGLRGR